MLFMVSGGFGLWRIAESFPESTVWQFVDYHVRHAAWVGCTAWDLIQPSFTFMVGVSLAYSCLARTTRGQSYGQLFAHAIFRAVFLTLLGVFLRSNGRAATYWTFEDVVSQIGLGYVLLFLLWRRGVAQQAVALGAILIGYWALFAFWPLPEASHDWAAVGVVPDGEHQLSGFAAHWNKNANPAHDFDVWFLNLFPRETPFTHNGGGYHTLSFIPSLATMIMGLMAGELLLAERTVRRKLGTLLVAGIAGLAAGALLDALGVCPLVKRIWTPSWTLYSGGWALLILVALYAIMDVGRIRAWAFPGIVVGLNPLTMYIMSGLLPGWLRTTIETHAGDVFGLLGDTYRPFLGKTVGLLILFLICLWMYRRKIFLRV